MHLLFDNIDKIYSVVFLLACSLYFRVLMQLVGQNWIKTVAHTVTIGLLPILTYVITNVISGNIALSLGMVGALSIVRFRNPVRSPLELSVYFGAITMGISAAVSIKWLLLLVVSVTMVVIVMVLINLVYTKFWNKPFFVVSFSEGSSISTLNITAQSDIAELNENDNLIFKSFSDDEFNYTLASADFDALREVEKTLQLKSEVQSLQLNR